MSKKIQVYWGVLAACLLSVTLIAVFAADRAQAADGQSPRTSVFKVELNANDPDSGFSLHSQKTVPAGANGFDVMTNIVQVSYITYDIGPFITSISGVKPQSGKYWALYIDGVYSTNKGINLIVITNDVSISWKTKS